MGNQTNNKENNLQNNFFKVSKIKLSYANKYRVSERPKIKSSQNAYDIFRSLWSDNIEFVEEFNILLLNRDNRVLGMVNISKGGTTGTVIDNKIIFSAALLSNSTSIILAHNHPSENFSPSQSDIKLTRKIKVAGEHLDIAILDHLIITKDSFYSFADEGML